MADRALKFFFSQLPRTSLSSVLGYVSHNIETNVCVLAVTGKYTWEQYL